MKVLATTLLILISLLVKSQITIGPVNVVSFKTKKIDSIYGIDVSYYQGKIDWTKIDTNIKFAIIKSSEGIRRTDNRFKYNWDSCKIIKGGYHFFRPQYSGEQQGKLFLSLVKSYNIRPVIDVEYTPYWILKSNRKKSVKNLIKMIDYVKKETGYKPIIYTSVNFWTNYVKPSHKESYTFWLADFRKKPTTMDWSIWQYTCQGKVSGIKPKVDKSITYNINTLLVK